MKLKNKFIKSIAVLLIALLTILIMGSCGSSSKPSSINHKVVLSEYSIGATLKEQKKLDNGDLQVVLKLEKNESKYSVYSINVTMSAKFDGITRMLIENTDFTVQLTGIITIKSTTLKKITSEEINTQVLVSYIPKTKYVQLDKTSADLVVGGDSVTVTASLSDGGSGIIMSTITSSIITITAKGNNTFEIKGKEVGETTIEFECDGYSSATLNVKVNSNNF